MAILTSPDKTQELPAFMVEGMARLKGFLLVQALVLLVPFTQACAGLTPWLDAWVMAAAAGACTVLAALGIRYRWGLRCGDPALLTVQILLNLALVALIYTCVPGARPVALQAMCLILVYDMHRLTPRQSKVVSVWSVAILLAGVAWSYGLNASAANIGRELLYALLAAAMVPAVLLVAENGNQLHAWEMKQHLMLTQTLAHLERLSRTDSLTGLLNRRQMQHLLDEEVIRTDRTGRAFALAILDIDHFKQVNDRFGHAVGDEALRTFARLLRQVFHKPLDHAARWGGEEFMVMLPESDLEGLAVRMAHLQQEVRRYDWAALAAGLSVTFSAGMGSYRSGMGLAQRLSQVDTALYSAKNQGRDRTMPMEPLDASRLASHTAAWLSELPLRAPQAETSHATSQPSDDLCASAVKAHWLLGRDRRMQHTLRLALIPPLLYSIWLVLTWVWGYNMGLISRQVALLFSVAIVLAATVPYLLIRVGATARLKDPLLMLPQMLMGAALTVAAYIWIPDPRPIFLQWLCHILIFGFLGLRPMASIVVGVLFCLMLLGAFFGGLSLQPSEWQPWVSGVQVAVSCAIFGLITLQSRRHAMVRERIKAEGRALEAATRKVRCLTTTDALTGLPNRDAVYAAALQECRRQPSESGTFGLALIDLDHFKRINDQHGHPVGDEVLVAFANVARQSLRAIDIVGRWGGEEFLVVLPETGNAQDGALPLERLRMALAQTQVSSSVPGLRVSLSAGLVTRQAQEPLERLIQRADMALYEAKRQGRNRIVKTVSAGI